MSNLPDDVTGAQLDAALGIPLYDTDRGYAFFLDDALELLGDDDMDRAALDQRGARHWYHEIHTAEDFADHLRDGSEGAMTLDDIPLRIDRAWAGDMSAIQTWATDGIVAVQRGFMPPDRYRRIKARDYIGRPRHVRTSHIKCAVGGVKFPRTAEIIGVAKYDDKKAPYKGEFLTSNGQTVLFDATRLAYLTKDVKGWRIYAAHKDAEHKIFKIVNAKGNVAYMMPMRRPQ